MLVANCKTICTISRRFVHKYLLKMDKAYFRNVEGTDQYHFTFRYENKDLNMDRQFNMVRQISEPISTFLTRLGSNIEKIIIKKNKKKDPNSIPSKINIVLEVNGKPIEGRDSNNFLCKEIFNSENLINLSVLGKSFSVVINSPWIESIALPSTLLASYPVYPCKLEAFNFNLVQSEFTWYNSENKKNWMEYSRKFIVSPGNELVGSYMKLKCFPRNGTFEGPPVEIESKEAIQASPGLCPFEVRHQFTKYRTSSKVFRVVTYNILADLYCDSDHTREVLYPYCPPYALQLDYRKQLIIKELLGYNADIICLQEVDQKVFKHDLQLVLPSEGFEGDFAIKGGEVAEGVATFYRSDKFTKIDSTRIVFCEHIDNDPLYSHIWSKISENEKLVTRILALKSTLQTVLLKSSESENELILIANTHLYFHPDAGHIRLLQGGCAITYIEHRLHYLKKQYPDKRISVIFCGDFNSVPECGIYKLFTTGSVPENFIDYQSNEEEAVKGLKLEQRILLASACGTPQYTNFTSGFADCLDYIYYQKDNLKVSQVIPFPSTEELTQHTALPSIVFPSDHVALVSDLEWLSNVP